MTGLPSKPSRIASRQLVEDDTRPSELGAQALRLALEREGMQPDELARIIFFCLGAGLPRLEAQTAFATLLRRFQRVELLEESPGWKPQVFFRGLRALRVLVHPRLAGEQGDGAVTAATHGEGDAWNS